MKAGDVVQALDELPARIRALTDRGVHPELLRKLIGDMFDASIQRFIALSLDGEPAPPATRHGHDHMTTPAYHEVPESAWRFRDAAATRHNTDAKWSPAEESVRQLCLQERIRINATDG